MSHEVETMAYAGQVPWHGLGARIDDNISPEEMLKAAGLDWQVDLLPLKADKPDGTQISVKDRFALVRSDNNRVLTIAGKSWRPLQNSEMLDFVGRYTRAGGAMLETAGSLRNGRTVWALANLNKGFALAGGDKVDGYLLFTSPHEVGRAITVRTTTVRVVCKNTMILANSHSELNYSQNHLSDFNFESAKESVEKAHQNLAAASRRWQRGRGQDAPLVGRRPVPQEAASRGGSGGTRLLTGSAGFQVLFPPLV